MARQDKVGSTGTAVTHTPIASSVKYHNTTVVQWNSAMITLNSGGWKSATTKLRMNQAASEFCLDFYVFSSGGEWFVTFQDEDIPFEDGMMLRR